MAGCSGSSLSRPATGPLIPNSPPEIVSIHDGDADPNFNEDVFIYYVPVDFQGAQQDRPNTVRWNRDIALRMAQQLAIANSDREGVAFFYRGAVRPFQSRLHYRLVDFENPIRVTRSAERGCASAAQEDLDAVVELVDRWVRPQGLRHAAYFLLLNTDCRDQASDIKINHLDSLPQTIRENLARSLVHLDETEDFVQQLFAEGLDRLLNDPDQFREWLESYIDRDRFAMHALDLIQKLVGPTVYYSVPAAMVTSGVLSRERIDVSCHEMGHQIAFLPDTYQDDLSNRSEGMVRLGLLIQALNQEIDVLEVIGIKDEVARYARERGVSVPNIRLNFLTYIQNHPRLIEKLGRPLGWSLCAATPEQGQQYAENLRNAVEALADEPVRYDREGCFYFGPDPTKGPNLLYRPDDDIMFHSRGGDFGVMSARQIAWAFRCFYQRSPISLCEENP